MSEQWEFKVPRIAWINQDQRFQITLPNGQQVEDISIGVLLSYWGAEGWELVNVVVERYVAEDISGFTDGPIVGTRAASQYRAFLKRRTS